MMRCRKLQPLIVVTAPARVLNGRAVLEEMMLTKELSSLVSTLGEMPETFRQLMLQLPPEVLTWKPATREFSVLEHLCHLRDLEREGYAVRIRKLLTETDPVLSDFDGDRIAAERDYNRQDFAAVFLDFARARIENLATLENLSPAQLQRRGTFEGQGEIDLEKLISMMHKHDEAHRRELSKLRQQLAARKGEE